MKKTNKRIHNGTFAVKSEVVGREHRHRVVSGVLNHKHIVFSPKQSHIVAIDKLGPYNGKSIDIVVTQNKQNTLEKKFFPMEKYIQSTNILVEEFLREGYQKHKMNATRI